MVACKFSTEDNKPLYNGSQAQKSINQSSICKAPLKQSSQRRLGGCKL